MRVHDQTVYDSYRPINTITEVLYRLFTVASLGGGGDPPGGDTRIKF